MGHVPFKDVYIHALIRDASGEKMSKTKGNVVDPLVMIQTYGCDAFRFTLCAFAAQGRDVRWDENRASGYHKFCNKIWQAFRFTMSHFNTHEIPQGGVESVYDQWILHRLGLAIQKVKDSLEDYKFNEAANAMYSFIWDELCDWYLEFSKATLYAEGQEEAKQATQRTLATVFHNLARLLHPVMPFLSEELWQKLPGTSGSVCQASYPCAETFKHHDASAQEAQFIKEFIVAVRRTKAEFGISPKESMHVWVKASPTQCSWLKTHEPSLQRLAKCSWQPLEGPVPPQVATESVEGAEIFMVLQGLIDVDAEITRLRKEITKTNADIERVLRQLNNADFMARAPQDIVDDKKEQLATSQTRHTSLQNALVRLQG
jgi:valyl-tRNA synthetase